MRKLLFVFVISILLLSCSDKEEEYPFDQSPYIEFEDLVFSDNTGEPDVMELSFIVWDREGDIGYIENDVDYPYHLYNIIVDSKNGPVKFENDIFPPFYISPMNIVFNPDIGELISQYDFQNKSFYSDVIDRGQEFSCDENVILMDGHNNPYDTLFGHENKFYRNLDVLFYQEDGTKVNFNEIFNSELCGIGDFNATLFDLSIEKKLNHPEIFKINRVNRYAWEITYNIKTIGLNVALQNTLFEIQFQLNDRELNESNIASSGLVTLEEITVE